MKHFIFFLFHSNPFVFLQFSNHFPKLQTWHMSMIFWQSNTLLGTPITECCRQLFCSKNFVAYGNYRIPSPSLSYSRPLLLFFSIINFLFFIFPFLFLLPGESAFKNNRETVSLSFSHCRCMDHTRYSFYMFKKIYLVHCLCFSFPPFESF